MRINKFVAGASGLSRRAADTAVAEGAVTVNGKLPTVGQNIEETDVVTLHGKQLRLDATKTIMFNKPAGYVVSRDGQGAPTVYDLLPPELHNLKPVGRLDKNSSGLLLMTNDGDLAEKLTHPRYEKTKIYEATLDKPLEPLHRQMINDHGIQLDDGLSQLALERIRDGNELGWRVTMHEGRNRQIRRTFAALGYEVTKLHRTHFDEYKLSDLKPSDYKEV